MYNFQFHDLKFCQERYFNFHVTTTTNICMTYVPIYRCAYIYIKYVSSIRWRYYPV